LEKIVQNLMADLSPAPQRSEANLGQRVRQIRKARGWTLQDLADRTNLAVSTISKMERGEISLTYDRFMRLAQGLGMDVGELFDADAQSFTQGSVAVTRAGDGPLHQSSTYDYEMLAAELTGKHMVPMVGHIKARSVAQFDQSISHPGEEFVYVISGVLTVNIDGRPPVTLEKGDNIYFDSAMGHAYVTAGDEDAIVLGVCWKPG
jgi:transcriptional regulator with XRE-family HTH domain